MPRRTPGIRQRSSGTWQVTVYTGRVDASGRYQRIIKTVHGTRRSAEEFRARLVSDLATGTYFRATRETVGVFLDRWLQSEAVALRPRSVQRYQQALRHITPHIGDLGLDQLDSGHLGAMLSQWQASGRSSATIAVSRAVLQRALHRAVQWKLIATNPCTEIDWPSTPRSGGSALDEAALILLLVALDAHEHRVAYRLMAHCGMRIGEVLGLRWQDLDLDGAAMRVVSQFDYSVTKRLQPTKDHRGGRPVDLDSTLVEILRAHRADQLKQRLRLGPGWTDLDLVVTRPTGKPVSHRMLYGPFKSIARRLGLPESFRPHDLRHTHASQLLATGADLKVIQERLGHATPEFTLSRYAHSLPGHQRAAAERVGNALRPVIDRTAS